MSGAEEIDEALQAFKAQAKREIDNYVAIGDSEYWLCLVFPTREHKDEFLRKAQAQSLGDKYINGVQMAAKMGIELPPAPVFVKSKIHSRWLGLSANLGRLLSQKKRDAG